MKKSSDLKSSSNGAKSKAKQQQQEGLLPNGEHSLEEDFQFVTSDLVAKSECRNEVAENGSETDAWICARCTLENPIESR